MTITINGTGTITGITAGGLPDAIITQPELATNVAGTGPAFSASQSANQSIATVTSTKIQFNTEDFDTNSNYDNATNYRFTPTVAGYYQINAQVRDGTGPVGFSLYCIIYKNGTPYKQSVGPTSAVGLSTNLSTVINFNGSTDYVEVYAFQNSGSAMLIGATTLTYFNGAMVRAA